MQPVAPPVPVRGPGSVRRRFGRYELIGELARGGMGTVYLARHAGEAGFQRLFAIKVMHPHLAEERAFVDMLHDEARISARIHHPNVVAIIDLGAQEDQHYVVLDYVEGMPFSTMLKHANPATFTEIAVTVIIDALEGLHAAHTLTDDDGNNLQLVHRDVSPQNILVGTDGLSRITDFGIAKAETRITSTQPGMRKGKLAFMAPEQIMNDEAIDCRADVWAAGVVLWTGLTGKHLFRTANDAGTIHSVLNKPVERPSAIAEGIPAHFDDVVLRALDRDPSQRFASALEMAEALRAAAHAHGMSCSKHKVAQWVTDTFGNELRARRQAIKAAATRRLEEHDMTDASRITVLSVLPTVGPHAHIGSGSTSLSRSNIGSSLPPAIHPRDQYDPSGSIVPYASHPAMFSPAELRGDHDNRPRRRRLAVTAGILGVSLAGALIYLIRTPVTRTDSTQNLDTAPVAPQTPAAARTAETNANAEPAAPSASPKSAAAKQGASTKAESLERETTSVDSLGVDEDGTSEKAATQKLGKRAVRSNVRKPAARAEKEYAAPAEPVTPEPEAPAPAARPSTPKPAADGVVIENNPYMRK